MNIVHKFVCFYLLNNTFNYYYAYIFVLCDNNQTHCLSKSKYCGVLSAKCQTEFCYNPRCCAFSHSKHSEKVNGRWLVIQRNPTSNGSKATQA